MLARAATSALGALCIGLALAVVVVAAIGLLGTRASTKLGNSIASDELTTSTATGQLARGMDTAYATGEEAFLASEPAQQSRLAGSPYTRLLPTTDPPPSHPDRPHPRDPPAERPPTPPFA